MSGLKINYNKSSLIGVGVTEAFTQSCASLLRCNVQTLPITYLGVPLTYKKLLIRDWAPLVRHFESRLSMWKGSCHSYAGRLVLIKSVLYSLPVYLMSLFKMPTTLVTKLAGYMRRFLWKGRIDGRCLNRVSWDVICSPYSVGGLNLHHLPLKNTSLLYKWIWRIRDPDVNSLWKFYLCYQCGYF